MPRLPTRDPRRTTARYAFIYPLLDDEGMPTAPLPIRTRQILKTPNPDLRQAAQLAIATGCMIEDFQENGSGCQRQLAASIRKDGTDRTLALVVKSRTSEACEAEMRRTLSQNGLQPPSKLKVQALFAKIEL